MADFPSITLSPESSLQRLNQRSMSYAVDGNYRGVDLGISEGAYQLSLVYPFINSSDLTTLQNFLLTNAGLAVSIDFHDGERYTGRYSNSWVVERVTAGIYSASIEFFGVRQ